MTDVDPHIGRVLANQYRIDSVLGAGGMGTVYRGVQLSVSRPVAIKLISQAISGSPEHVQRFRREAEAMSKLEHPAIVRLYDFGLTEDGLLYLVMELLAGRDLSKDLIEDGPIAPERALRLCLRILNALRRPHELGIVHRDLKPQNIFLTSIDGDPDFVKIMDFGLARLHDNDNRLTRVGDVMGTPAYMSPEQAQGTAVDIRSDLYAVGIILFVMLTGRVPFDASTAMALLAQQISTPPYRLDVVAPHLRLPPRVQALLDHLLAKDPGARPASAASAATMVHAAIADLAAMEVPPQRSAPPPPSPAVAMAMAPSTGIQHAQSLAAHTVTAPPRKPPWLAIVAGGAALAGVIALIAILASGGADGDKTASSGPGTGDAGQQPTAAAVQSLTVASKPSGATVLQGGAELGTTPYRLEFRAATTIELRLEGHRPAQLSVVPGGEPTMIVELEALPANPTGDAPTATIATNARVARPGRRDPNAPPPITAPPPVRPRAGVGARLGSGETASLAPPPALGDGPRLDRGPKPGQPLIGAAPATGARAGVPSVGAPAGESRQSRRQRMLRAGPPFNNMAAAKKAYRGGKISTIELEDIGWVLGRYRDFKKREAKKQLAAGRISRAQHDAAVAEADRFFRDGPR